MTVPTTPAAVETVTLTVDGVKVSAPKGAMIIRAAEQIGVEIPRFCDHPLLEPVGACRQCLVEVATPGRDGAMMTMPKPQPACAVAVSEGMEVKTQQTSPKADKAQRGVLELLLVNHPLDCPVCDKGGECPLQNQALSHGDAESRFTDVKRTFAKPFAISTNVLLDRERCVLCQRCTRFSDQIAGDPFIALVERGAEQQIGIYQEQPFASYFSGNTVQICPVGALTGAAYRFRSRPFDLVSTPSACEHCASGCSLRIDHRRGTVLRRQAINKPETNEEWNCDKGRWAFAYAVQPTRLTTPLVRDGDHLRPASWPEALDVAARGLEKARHGAGVGVLPGGRLNAENAYGYSKFARVALGTNDVDYRSRPHSDEEAAFIASRVVATGPADSGGAVTYADLERAAAVFLVGFEPEEESPMVFLRLRKATRKNKTAVYAIAPFASRGLTKLKGTLLPAAPGTETEVLTALREKRSETSGAADALTDQAIILVGERLALVPGALSAASALASATGARLAWIPRRAGERSAIEAGCLPGLLPGGRPVGEAGARTELEQAWQVDALPSVSGRDATAIVESAASGALDALVVGGVDVADLPNADRAAAALDRAFVVSLELNATPVTAAADVVFPVADLSCLAGAYVNWEGRLIPFAQALTSNAMPDYRVLDMLADAMGLHLGLRSLEATRDDMRSLGSWQSTRPAAPAVAAQSVPRTAPGEAVLATWHHLLDDGVLQVGEPFLAGTAPVAVSRISTATASAAGVVDGELLTVSTDHGSVTLPVEITEMVDHVVWLPTNSGGTAATATLRAQAGDVVRLSKGEVR